MNGLDTWEEDVVSCDLGFEGRYLVFTHFAFFMFFVLKCSVGDKVSDVWRWNEGERTGPESVYRHWDALRYQSRRIAIRCEKSKEETMKGNLPRADPIWSSLEA